jgi:adenylate cyclase
MSMITADELAELVPCTVEQVARLAELGLVERVGERFPSSAVHNVRLMRAFAEAGIPVEDVARGVAAGELSFPLGLFLPEPSRRPTTYEELAARVGRPAGLLRRLHRELGLASPDDRLREEDAQILALLVTRLDLADEEELSRFARLYGGTLQRLIGAGLQFFDRAVRQRVAAFDLRNDEKDRLVYERAGRFTELVSALVPWLQRRHREHAVLEYLVAVTERFIDERGIAPGQLRRPPAIAFLDLTGFTALAEERGDEAAAELAASLAGVVHEAVRELRGRAVKWLGDGVMFYFADPRDASASGLDLVERAERATSVPARMGINAGAVIAQEGDYFGRTVNVAARIADYARPREVLVSEDARQSAGSLDVAFELVGDVPLKGLSRPVRLHRATRAAR